MRSHGNNRILQHTVEVTKICIPKPTRVKVGESDIEYNYATFVACIYYLTSLVRAYAAELVLRCIHSRTQVIAS